MVVICHNRKLNDEIPFEIEELNEETRQYILQQIHLRGWENRDCWSEVKDGAV